MITLFATCARGFEELLKNELVDLGASSTQIVQGGVRYEVDKHGLYRSLLWSRFASRILLPIASGKIFDEVDLYGLAVAQPWKDYFTQTDSFRVNFTGTNNIIRHTQYGAMRVKDGVVDYFERKSLPRPNVDKEYPDIRLHAYLNRDEITLYIDLSGESLHRRGYREISGEAPLRETLAAAIISRSGYQVGEAVVDPMCGSGTLLIEAAQIAADVAPRLDRIEWGFRRWLGHEEDIWQEVLSEADERKFEGLQKAKPLFYGFDIDSKVLNKAKHNAKMAGVEKLIRFTRQDVAQLKNPLKESEKSGLVISNPPYGERLGSTPALIALYNVFGERLKAEFGGWRASIFSGEPQLLDCLRMRAKRQFKARNGALDCVQKNYLISQQRNTDVKVNTLQQETIVATDFANRLQKNIKKIDKWAAQQGLQAYRLYDADLPEYNLAVDRYADHIVVQEYAAPKNIDPQKSRQRLLDAVSATLSVTGVETNKLVLKTREKQKGRNQYEKQGDQGNYFVVDEFNAQFWVNVTDYLDTGLFLDHRLTRKMVGEMAKGKNFLNLFAYTGSATIHAQLGGAKTTTTVDMSNTYLNWAEQNMLLNDFEESEQHQLIQADCLQWLENCEDKFDLIFVDPPTFSNSKRMNDSWDVQRDHKNLFTHLKRILNAGGEIVFSNNKRGFKMDLEGLAELGLVAENISSQTLPLDFARNKQIHNCWIVTFAK